MYRQPSCGGDAVNWEAIGTVGQVLGSIAVFVTIWYLAIQVRHARQSSQVAISQGSSQAIRELIALTLDPRIMKCLTQADRAFGRPPHPLLAPIMEKTGLDSESALTVLTFHSLDWAFRMQTLPHLDEFSPSERVGFDSYLRSQYSGGAGGFIYENFLKHISHPDAGSYVDRLLERAN
jgi:hypothetical protein